jgi:hypothetical protein
MGSVAAGLAERATVPLLLVSAAAVRGAARSLLGPRPALTGAHGPERRDPCQVRRDPVRIGENADASLLAVGEDRQVRPAGRRASGTTEEHRQGGCRMGSLQTTGDQLPRREWLLGFLGFLGFFGFQAFASHQPALLFWFAFFSFFSAFRFVRRELQYLGLLGVAGLAIAVLGVIGVVQV